ncbi:TlpA family protein disulfide reductase, partial [Duncaniella muris]
VMKAEKGYTAPEIEMLVNDSVEVSLSQLRGKYVLVNFWDSENAVSRIAAGEYDRYFRNKTYTEPFTILSVNTDSDPKFFKEVVKKDNLEASTQFHITDAKMKNLEADYRLNHGFASYLINPQGKIIAVNPSISCLQTYLTGS